jgi:acyl dehydratase
MPVPTVPFRWFEDASEGEKLPALDFPITIKTLTLAVCGTRDLMPYHHDSAYSKSVGNRDMFVNTMFEQALFGRFVTDWSGPESDFRETSLTMLNQLCPGDVARVEGSVKRKYEHGADRRVEIEIYCSNPLGVCATGSATLAMPSKTAGYPQPMRALAKPVVERHPQLPDFAKPWLGEISPKEAGAYPVSEAQILYWCDMVEDPNPLYVDGEYARASRYGGVIAPPMSLLTFAMTRGGHQGVDSAAPDANCPTRKPWPPREERAGAWKLPMPPGARETIAQGSVQTYGPPLRPGDRVFQTTEVVNCSPLKQTKLGPGYFQTNLNTYFNQRGEIVGTNVFILLRYGVSQ